MAEKLIVIIGITGNQGTSVANTFLPLPGWKIRGLSRDPSKPSATKWSDKGVEMVAGDLDDTEKLRSAFTGASVIFGTTDFWQYFFQPSVNEQAAKEGRSANEVAFDIEARQGRNIVDAAAGVEGLERLVLSTLSKSRKWSNGAVTWNYHFDSKWAAVDYLREKYPELDAKTSLVQLGAFLTNWQSGMLAPKKQKDGTFVLAVPCKPDTPIPMVQPQIDTGEFVKALVETAPGKNLMGCGSLLSWSEWCKKWGEHNGVTCNYVQIPEEVLWTALPGTMGKETGAMFTYMSEYTYWGRDPSVVFPWDLDVPVKVTTVDEYNKTTDWSSLLNADPE